MEQLKDYIMLLYPKYEHELIVEPDPEQSFILGNRWADYGLCFAFALALPIVRAFLRSRIYQPLGERVMFRGKQAKGPVQLERLRKWNESCWKGTIFSTFVIVATIVSFHEKWFTDTRYFWLGCSHFPPCNMTVSRGVLLFFALETGFYIQAIHFLLFHEVRRKDWAESMTHHVATVILLVYAYYVNFARVGTMVLLVHDVSDIFLESAKLARYAKRQTLAMTLFGIFLVVWVATRNVYFPLVLIRSTLSESLHYADVHNIEVEPHYTIFNSLLLLLLVLHVYWTWLIIKVLLRQLKTGDGRDVREGDASEDDSDEDDSDEDDDDTKND